jgi:hypothetical protein
MEEFQNSLDQADEAGGFRVSMILVIAEAQN